MDDREGFIFQGNCTTPPYRSGDFFWYYTPDMTTIHYYLRWPFFIHMYGFSCLFFFLAFYAFFSLLNIRSQMSSSPYLSVMNSLLAVLGMSRAAELLIDPYGLKKIMPLLITNLLQDMGFPCLLSNFGLVRIMYLHLTKQMDLAPELFQRRRFLSRVITFHFALILAATVCTSINRELYYTKLFIQLGFALWGLVLCSACLYARKANLFSWGQSGTSGTGALSNEKGIANLFGLGLMAPGQNMMSSLTAALAPTLLQSSGTTTTTTTPATTVKPKIRITDENDRSLSAASGSSTLNEEDNIESPIPGPSFFKESECVTSPTATNAPAHIPTVRPPSPILPRSIKGGLRGGSSSIPSGRLSFQRRDSGPRLSISGDKATGEPRKKSLTWLEADKDGETERTGRRKSSNTKLTEGDTTGDGSGTQSGTERNDVNAKSPDYTLQSILSHIAHVNQTALDFRLRGKLRHKNQVGKILKYSSITAVLGILLCLAEIIRIISPYGILASSSIAPLPWPWFVLQTILRSLEFAMGATLANITKEPVNPPSRYAYSIRHKHPRDSFYL